MTRRSRNPALRSQTSSPADRESPLPDSPPSRSLFVRNRRDGARLLSSVLIITVIGLVNWGHPVGRAVALLGGAISLYWWLCYRQLSQ
ncbi:MAG: hypothetical protein VKK97_11890 [Synechococcaceae cyanobacterium]|nr:hypothetical protein [Synechococcaceae cyanobacterium]